MQKDTKKGRVNETTYFPVVCLKLWFDVRLLPDPKKWSFGGGIILLSVCLTVCLLQYSVQSIGPNTTKITLNIHPYTSTRLLNFGNAQLHKNMHIL